MAQDTTPALVMYIGDGTQTRFEVPFDKGAYGEIKVAFVRRGLTDYTYDPTAYTVDGYLYAWNGGVYTKTEQPDTSTPLYDKDGVATGDTWVEGMYREPKNDIFTQAVVEWTGDTLTSNDVICIVRESAPSQPYSYPNNQKHIERALDNLSRQIQEIAKKGQNALLVDPSWMSIADGGVADENKLDPVEWLQTIVRSKGKTLRELIVDNDYAMYTSDDPDSTEKTWNVIAGVKTGNAGVISHIRENAVTLQDGTIVRYLQYSIDGGTTWRDCANSSDVSFSSIYGSPYDNTALENSLNGKVNIDGTSVMTGVLKFASGSFRGGISGGLNGVTFFKMDAQGNPTQIGSLSDSQFVPSTDNTLDIGTSVRKVERIYVGKLNNGYDIDVPVTNSPDSFALKSQLDLAATSGIMITNQGVWYAKMETATVPPASAEVEGRNYADFSQVDGNNDPIIVIYTYTSGAWVQTETITPPSDYDGYVLVTSKIWDIPEQTDQQGGRILWNHVSQEFTPYPTIITFEGATINNGTLTGNSTVTMPQNPGQNQIVNKDYVDSAISGAVKDATITITQGGVTKGTFTLNQATNETIDLDAGAGGGHECIEFQAPTGNHHTWYRKYADGWVEQGGEAAQGTVNLPVEMSDTHYTVITQPMGSGGNPGSHVQNRTTTSFIVGNGSGWSVCWEVKGMYAQS